MSIRGCAAYSNRTASSFRCESRAVHCRAGAPTRWCTQATVRRRTREQGGTWALITFGRSCMQKVLTGMKEGPPGPRTKEMSMFELRKIDPKRAMQSTGEFGNKFHEAMQKAADEFQELKRDRDRMWPYEGAGVLSRDAPAEGEPPDAAMRCAHFLHRNQ